VRNDTIDVVSDVTAAAQARRGVRLTGATLAAEIRARVSESAAALADAGRPPRLAVVVATADESTAWYVRSIAKAAAKVGITCDIVDLDPSSGRAEIDAALRRLSADPSVHGVILQTPLPPGVDFATAATAIDLAKDVDGANPGSLGRLAAGLPAFPPATAQAVVALLGHYDIPLAGRDTVVVGRSTVVGKPLAHLLLDRDATVTVCHSRTADLAGKTSRADVVVAAVGRPGLIGQEHVRPDAIVVDVGTNATADGGLVGDVDPAVQGHVAGLTPVPGGIGPVTTALLLEHTVRAAEVTSR
jgi:methylenetetrahydrofolate dehydrogenase (NADP+)/methenyltetrahydrofolate cyclohydrolase